MEIHYCSKCRLRVSSVDLEAGRGSVFENEVYCHTCAREFQDKQAPLPKSKVTAKTKLVKKSIHQRRTGSSSGRGPHKKDKMQAQHGGLQRTGTLQKKSLNIVMVMLAVLILLLGVIVTRLFLRKSRKQTPSQTAIVTQEPETLKQETPSKEKDTQIAPEEKPTPSKVQVQPKGTPCVWNNNGGDGLWSNSANWSGNEVPGPGDDVILKGTSSAHCMVDSVSDNIRSITVTVDYNSTITLKQNLANGGNGNQTHSGGGGGGRIAVFYRKDTSSLSTSLTASGGPGINKGGNGSVMFMKKP